MSGEHEHELELERVEREVMDDLRRARACGRRLPDFFIVGHAKCGTTALYEMLRRHPQIYMSAIKEPEFLSRADRLYAQRDALAAAPAKVLPQTLDAYLALFAPAGREQLAGEASTEYLRTPASAARIAELCPHARIVAILREPVSFLHSLHLQLLQVRVETEADFERAMGLERQRRAGKHVPRGCPWPAALLYSQHVRYVEQLRAYRERFDPERVLVAVYDDFRDDSDGFVRDVLRFLGVDDSVALEQTQANPTLRIRSRRAEGLVNAVSTGRGPVAATVKGAVKRLTPARVRRDALGAALRMVVDNEPRAPDERFVTELRARFKGEVLAASEYLERDLVSLWGYDAL